MVVADGKEAPRQSAETTRVTLEYPSESVSVDRVSITLTNSANNNVVLDVDPPEKKIKAATVFRVTLKFDDVVYSTKVKRQESWFQFKSSSEHDAEKTILKGCISGTVKPGEILAMLGPSGSGKTTLLSILGGRQRGKMSGTVMYNDSPITKAMRRRTGFVAQDDVLLPHLTVKETLVYAAFLRLPKGVSQEAKVQRAEDVITELGLQKCKNTMIGSALVRGVSGGEKKRVSIGHEMLIDPSLLLLDEPTSGLDSTIALKIIQTLQDLASGGRSIVTTIHQPSSIIFHTFTKLLLLSEGQALYYGKGSDVLLYFESVGFRPSFATNPAEFILNLANGVMQNVTTDGYDEESMAGGEPKDFRVTLREAYAKHLLPKARASISESPLVTEEAVRGAVSQARRRWPTSWPVQFRVLIERGMNERRHEVYSSNKLFQVVVVSIVSGLLWWQSSPDNIQDQLGLLFYITMFWAFLPVYTAIFTFPDERRMLIKERMSGMYPLSAYFFARILGDLPLELLLPTLSASMVYWMGGLKRTFPAYVSSLFVTLMNVMVSQGMGLLIGASMMNVRKAMTLSSVLLLTLQLSGGYFVQNTPAWIGWLKYVSSPYHAFKLQLSTQYSNTQTYACGTGRCLIVENPQVDSVGIDRVGTSVMAMLLMIVGFRFLAYVSLRRMKL